MVTHITDEETRILQWNERQMKKLEYFNGMRDSWVLVADTYKYV